MVPAVCDPRPFYVAAGGVIVPRLLANRPDAHWLLRRRLGVAPHYRSPTSAMEPAGQDLGAPSAPEINGSLARDRFDNDCVLGTQFESSQPHHAIPRYRRSAGCRQIGANLRAFAQAYGLCKLAMASSATGSACLSLAAKSRFLGNRDAVGGDSAPMGYDEVLFSDATDRIKD